jgi:hypothetical protein
MNALLLLALLGTYTDVGYASTTGVTFTGQVNLTLGTKFCLDTEKNDCVAVNTEDRIDIQVNGGDAFFIRTSGVDVGSGKAGLINMTPSATVPNVVPNTNDGNTGMGASGTDAASLIANALEVARFSATTDRLFQLLGGLKPVSKTSDPCADTTNFPPGAVFYNSTSAVHCFCNAANADIRMVDNATACF